MANTHDADVTADRKVRGGTKAERGFLDKEGVAHPRAFADVVAVRIKFVETESELVMNLSELPEGILRAAAAFGLNTSVGNTFGAIADPDEALEAAESRWETLKSGTWSAERQVGPRTTDLLEAVIRHYQANGRQVDEAGRERLTVKLQDPAQVKATMADAKIGVHLAAIRMERAEARAKAAAMKAEAGGNASSAVDSLLD